MFYSHNLLARKGPLGTVWCAAHLQSKLKKSNYITINIPSTVEQIMNPQVPIALRMSGHLLLGVVRIYSKKVEYLQHDYNVLRMDINKAYTYVDINLPEDANQARYESITLPDNFALDALDLNSYDLDGSPDNHLKNREDITLADKHPNGLSNGKDQIPPGYILISLTEDVSGGPSRSGEDAGTRPLPEENVRPSTPPETTAGNQDPGPDDFTGEGSDPQIEITRDAVHDESLQPFPAVVPDMAEPDPVLEEQLLNEKDHGSAPSLDEILVPGGQSLPLHQTPPLGSAPSEPGFDPHMSHGLPSPVVAVQPSPAAAAADQPRAKRRRIDYDKDTVLTNKFMKKCLDDPSDLMRKRKGVYSSLDVWKLNKKRKKERVLLDPVFTGICDNLRDLFEKDKIPAGPDVVTAEADRPDDIEMERLRDFVGSAEHTGPMHMPLSPDTTTTRVPSPDDDRYFSSPPRQTTERTPAATSTNAGSKSYQVQTTVGTTVGPTPDPMSSTGSFVSEMETPVPFSQERQGFENSGGLSGIPEVEDSGELTFLEDDEATPARLRGTPEANYSSGRQRPPPEVDSLLARTRAVARYIREKSSATPTSEDARGSLSLNSVLEGKKRKVCARMFFETLVLKSCDLVDVKQDEPYGDITLKVTSKLAKERFSS